MATLTKEAVRAALANTTAILSDVENGRVPARWRVLAVEDVLHKALSMAPKLATVNDHKMRRKMKGTPP